jgi:hypothetical protein
MYAPAGPNEPSGFGGPAEIVTDAKPSVLTNRSGTVYTRSWPVVFSWKKNDASNDSAPMSADRSRFALIPRPRESRMISVCASNVTIGAKRGPMESEPSRKKLIRSSESAMSMSTTASMSTTWNRFRCA